MLGAKREMENEEDPKLSQSAVLSNFGFWIFLDFGSLPSCLTRYRIMTTNTYLHHLHSLSLSRERDS